MLSTATSAWPSARQRNRGRYIRPRGHLLPCSVWHKSLQIVYPPGDDDARRFLPLVLRSLHKFTLGGQDRSARGSWIQKRLASANTSWFFGSPTSMGSLRRDVARLTQTLTALWQTALLSKSSPLEQSSRAGSYCRTETWNGTLQLRPTLPKTSLPRQREREPSDKALVQPQLARPRSQKMHYTV